MNDKELARAKSIVFRLLKDRVRSEQELRERLALRKISRETIDKVAEDFKKASLIDDKEFTRAWIEGRINKGCGFFRIKQELEQKGIGQDLINEVLGEFKDKIKDPFFYDDC